MLIVKTLHFIIFFTYNNYCISKYYERYYKSHTFEHLKVMDAGSVTHQSTETLKGALVYF